MIGSVVKASTRLILLEKDIKKSANNTLTK